MDHNTFFTKIFIFYFFLKGPKLWKSERETERDRDRGSEQDRRYNSIFRALRVCCFDKRYSTGGPLWTAASPRLGARRPLAGCYSHDSRDFRTYRIYRGYTYIISSRPWILPIVNPRNQLTRTFCLLSVINFSTQMHPVKRNPWLVAWSKVSLDLGAMAMKMYSIFPKAPKLEPHH